MQAGKLDRRVTIERATVTRDETNSPVETWATLATVWASKSEVSDGERQQAQGPEAQATVRFQIRYFATVADLNAKDRISFGGKTFNIFHVKEIGRREGLEISAAAKADA